MKRAPQPADVEGAWQRALALWGVRLGPPQMVPGEGAQQGSFAWFGFPPTVHVDPELLAAMGGAAELETVFAHEIGHHVLAPATRIDDLKIRHQIARALRASGVNDVVNRAARMANIWSDLLINTRVQRAQAEAGTGDTGMVRLWKALRAPSDDRIMWLYLSASERLWRLPPGTLIDATPPPSPAALAPQDLILNQAGTAQEWRERLAALAVAHPEVDPLRLAELAETFAHDPIGGAPGFGLLVAPYLLEQQRAQQSGNRRGRGRRRARGIVGTGCESAGGRASAEELARVLADRRMTDPLPGPPGGHLNEGPFRTAPDSGQGQSLGLADTLDLYGSLPPEQVQVSWYRALAAPSVTTWRRRRTGEADADLPGPLATWENGDDLADLDWPATLSTSPVVVPGVTTRRREYLDDEAPPVRRSIALDLYVDSSGSMRRPADGSPAVLAGAILSLSILRGGGSVRVTSFSGPGDVAGDPAFLTRSDDVLAGLLHYFGGSTSFPLDLYEERYAHLDRPSETEQRHVVVLSDDGLISMFDRDSQYAGAAARVRSRLTTGTVLVMDAARRIAQPAADDGYDVIYLRTMDDAPRACARLAEVLCD